MIVRLYLVTLWALLCVSCGPTVAQSVAVFDFELIDTSLEGAIRGARADEQERLARVSDQLRQILRNSGRFSLVDITPIAREAQTSNLQACGGCDMRLAQRIGAELAITGTVQKVSNSNPQHEHLRSRRLNRSDHCGHERGHARQYRRDVVTHARLAGSQSASRAWLWPTAVVARRGASPRFTAYQRRFHSSAIYPMTGPDDGGWRRPAAVTHNGRGPLRVTNGQKRGRKTHVDARERHLWLVKKGGSLRGVSIFDSAADQFLENQLKPRLLENACTKAGVPLTLRMHEGYDHSYFFISTFIEDHLRWHAQRLGITTAR